MIYVITELPISDDVKPLQVFFTSFLKLKAIIDDN